MQIPFLVTGLSLSVALTANAACVPSATNFCVTHNGSSYVVNGTARLPLTLVAGTVYTFTLNNVPSIHPFYLTTSSLGGGIAPNSVAHVDPDFAVSGNTIVTFSPSVDQVGSSVYYQCAIHERMGAKITIVAPPCAPDFNHDGTLDHFDYLDFVAAFTSQSASSDFNHDAAIDFFDYLDFLSAFVAGC